MKLFKNRVFALLLTVMLVIASTLISTNLKLGRKCSAVTDGFYDGVTVNGITQPAIAAQLRNICSSADSLAVLASSYGLDVQDVEDNSQWLKNAMRYSREDASYIYYEYEHLMKALTALQIQLDRTELSARDAESVSQLAASVADAQSNIDGSAYNDSVREFLRKYDRPYTYTIASMAGVRMPEYFS